MAIVLGSMTQVNIGGVTNGFQSINWNIDRQPTRLWQLGSWDPYRTQVGATINVSVTTYAGAIAAITLVPSTSCADSSATKNIIISASACGGDPVDINYSSMFLSSYSYSKGDPLGLGTESWTFQKWIDSGVTSPFISVPIPSYILQGRTEGSRSGNIGNGTTDLGVRFVAEPGTGQVVSGEQGSVSAGFPGQGEANITYLGMIDRVGGGLLEAAGETGQSSATIPLQPIYA